MPPSVPAWAARGLAAAELWRYRLTRRPPRLLRGDLGLFGERCRVSTDKARQLLSWQPAVDLERGMAAVGERLRAEGRIAAGPEDPSTTGATAFPYWVSLRAG
jgi:nucleoside-diphosphate-sugar epimerase